MSGNLDFDVVIVGAGISGIAAGIELLRRGQTSFVLLEAGSELGGTWRDNTYPGVAVDIPSISYSFSFETDYPWSRVFAPGEEIQAYVNHCASKYGVTPHIRYESRVTKTTFDAGTNGWSTLLATGERLTSRYVISATGLLSQPKLPAIAGLESFGGKAMHTARWDHDYDLSGKRVAIIGTGASAVQIVPRIAEHVAHLSVFQRTPIWVSPRFDGPLNPRSPLRLAPVRGVMRFFSELSLDVVTAAIVNYRKHPAFVRTIGWLVRHWMRRQVNDPELAAKLTPNYGLGCKRPAISNTYLKAFNRANVSLVTDGIAEIRPTGVVTQNGVLHEVDTLILATGFLTTEQGNTPSFEVFGAGGVELGQFWEDHRLQAYAGVSVHGFPNFFLTAGPYAGGFNWFAMLEANLNHIMACMDDARARGATRVEIGKEAHDKYMRHMWKRADGTVFKADACSQANSYYLDSRGDASLPLPHTPWWRAIRGRIKRTDGYEFG
ncbi:MAG: NAD(P)/FAD-dependent oxidoreductase [bacterium]